MEIDFCPTVTINCCGVNTRGFKMSEWKQKQKPCSGVGGGEGGVQCCVSTLYMQFVLRQLAVLWHYNKMELNWMWYLKHTRAHPRTCTHAHTLRVISQRPDSAVNEMSKRRIWQTFFWESKTVYSCDRNTPVSCSSRLFLPLHLNLFLGPDLIFYSASFHSLLWSWQGFINV